MDFLSLFAEGIDDFNPSPLDYLLPETKPSIILNVDMPRSGLLSDVKVDPETEEPVLNFSEMKPTIQLPMLPCEMTHTASDALSLLSGFQSAATLSGVGSEEDTFYDDLLNLTYFDKPNPYKSVYADWQGFREIAPSNIATIKESSHCRYKGIEVALATQIKALGEDVLKRGILVLQSKMLFNQLSVSKEIMGVKITLLPVEEGGRNFDFIRKRPEQIIVFPYDFLDYQSGEKTFFEHFSEGVDPMPYDRVIIAPILCATRLEIAEKEGMSIAGWIKPTGIYGMMDGTYPVTALPMKGEKLINRHLSEFVRGNPVNSLYRLLVKPLVSAKYPNRMIVDSLYNDLSEVNYEAAHGKYGWLVRPEKGPFLREKACLHFYRHEGKVTTAMRPVPDEEVVDFDLSSQFVRAPSDGVVCALVISKRQPKAMILSGDPTIPDYCFDLGLRLAEDYVLYGLFHDGPLGIPLYKTMQPGVPGTVPERYFKPWFLSIQGRFVCSPAKGMTEMGVTSNSEVTLAASSVLNMDVPRFVRIIKTKKVDYELYKAWNGFKSLVDDSEKTGYKTYVRGSAENALAVLAGTKPRVIVSKVTGVPVYEVSKSHEFKKLYFPSAKDFIYEYFDSKETMKMRAAKSGRYQKGFSRKLIQRLKRNPLIQSTPLQFLKQDPKAVKFLKSSDDHSVVKRVRRMMRAGRCDLKMLHLTFGDVDINFLWRWTKSTSKFLERAKVIVETGEKFVFKEFPPGEDPNNKRDREKAFLAECTPEEHELFLEYGEEDMWDHVLELEHGKPSPFY